jgi:hypothetical protein
LVELIKDFDRVLRDFPAAGVFTKPAYLGACSSEYGWFLSDRYVLPFYVDRIMIFRRLVFTDAPVARVDAREDIGAQQKFIDDVVQLVRASKICDFISKPQSNAVFQVAPAESTACPWGTYEVRIDRSDDELLKAFHGKHRNVIGKAIRDGVTVAILGDLKSAQENIRDTLLRQKLPYYPSLSFLEALSGRQPDQLLVMGAYVGNQLQGVAIAPFDRHRGYYLYGGSIARPATGALNLLQFEVMRWLRDRGVSTYDFVGARLNVEPGSKFEGIQNFKVRFGCSLRSGKAFRVVFSPLKFTMFRIAIRTYFLCKGWGAYTDPIDQIKICNERNKNLHHA